MRHELDEQQIANTTMEEELFETQVRLQELETCSRLQLNHKLIRILGHINLVVTPHAHVRAGVM